MGVITSQNHVVWTERLIAAHQRGDVEGYEGREIKPEDNGYLTEGYEQYASKWQKEKAEKLPID